jgi:two-component system, cell cycle sensor histidine kinase and response regulator CckA
MPFITIIAFVVAAAVLLVLAILCARQHRTINDLGAHFDRQARTLTDVERQRELLFLSNPYPMWTYDRVSLRFLDVNRAAIQSYGFSREEFLAMKLTEIRPPEDTPLLLEMIARKHAEFIRPGVWRHRRKDGSIMLVTVAACQYEEDGQSRELVVVVDITEKCRMEEALRASEASLKALVDNAPFGIAQSSLDNDRLTTVNPALLDILGGYSDQDAKELQMVTQVYADAKERDRLIEVLRRSGKVKGWETSFRRRDGTLVPVRITGVLSGSGNGTPRLFSKYIEDLTQQSTLEQQVRQVQKLEAVGRLAGGMAHDFNNILVVIKLSTDMLLSQVMPGSLYSKPLLQISHAADRAAALTKQMLAFGRQQIMQPRIINLNAVVSETTHMLRRLIGEDIDLVTDLAETVENSRLDPDQVTQVILNLAVNARDAMPHGGTLHLETSSVILDDAYAKDHPPVQPGRYVMMAVSDTGTGIDRSILPRIFDPFFTTKEVGKGTGLGLSIVYGIVKQSGGYIWVYSEPGHGTTFKLYFPVTTASLDRTAVRAESTAHPSGQVVLVVDDEANIRSNLRDCLQQLGYQVLTAETGRSALKICEDREGKVDLVLTDLVMPGQNGRELANDLAERYPDVPVLFMSGYTEDNAARREILLKGSSFLQKPFSVADLASAVHDALTLKSIVK